MIKIIGGGLAGAEVANQLVKHGISATLFDMKPLKKSPAHKSGLLGELVCSNSLKSDNISTPSGLLKAEMREFDSLILRAAEESKVDAGGALAVDRVRFAEYIDKWLKSQKLLKVETKEVDTIDDDGYTVIATGPLTSDALNGELKRLVGERLHFYDAAAPIVSADSIDYSKAFMQGRYGQDDDYVNCPLNKGEYDAFVDALVNAEGAELHEFDKREFFEGCMPVEVMAKRGRDTLRFGMLKPVGLTDVNTGKRPYAVVQLRAENVDKTMYNIVGFQTNLKFDEQKRVFSMIPALNNAEYLRYGVMHRNSYVNAPEVLNSDFSLRNKPNIYIAGQLSGVEGYMESAMSGMIAGMSVACKVNGKTLPEFPRETMMGAITSYIVNADKNNFQPMNANFGIIPELPELIKDKRLRKEAKSKRAIELIRVIRENM